MLASGGAPRDATRRAERPEACRSYLCSRHCGRATWSSRDITHRISLVTRPAGRVSTSGARLAAKPTVVTRRGEGTCSIVTRHLRRASASGALLAKQPAKRPSAERLVRLPFTQKVREEGGLEGGARSAGGCSRRLWIAFFRSLGPGS